MMSRFFQNIEVGAWTQLSVVVFLITFLIMLVWVYLPVRRTVYDNVSKIPLEDK